MENFSLADAFWRMFFSLALVLILLIGLLWLVRRFLPHRLSKNEGGKAISVLASHYFGPNKALLLIEVLGKPMLVGLTNQQLTHLATLDDESSREQLRQLHQAEKGRHPLGYSWRPWGKDQESPKGKDG